MTDRGFYRRKQVIALAIVVAGLAVAVIVRAVLRANRPEVEAR